MEKHNIDKVCIEEIIIFIIIIIKKNEKMKL
jgi:hypothetical protein